MTTTEAKQKHLREWTERELYEWLCDVGLLSCGAYEAMTHDELIEEVALQAEAMQGEGYGLEPHGWQEVAAEYWGRARLEARR